MTRTGAPRAGRVAEIPADSRLPLLVQPEWQARMPWLFQAITWRGAEEPFDLGLFGAQPVGQVMARWRSLLHETGFDAAVHSRQAHGPTVAVHSNASPGLRLIDGFDAHVTRTPGLLLTISVADCIPVYFVAEPRRAIALAHAGWRGVATGVLESAIATLRSEHEIAAKTLHVHLGPAICGACYEVGPEVHRALGQPVPEGPTPIDLTRIAIERLIACGVPAEQITYSGSCPKHEADRFFSHRAGSAGRQMALLGIRRR